MPPLIQVAADSDSDAPVVKKKAAPKKKAVATSDDDVPVKKAPVKKAVRHLSLLLSSCID